MTKRRKIDPKEVVNRLTAPWYVSENERECLFTCGFLCYVNGDYEGAKKHFEQVREVDANVAKLVGLNWPNVYWRLISACNVKRMIFPAEDKRHLKGRNKLRCAYAELNYLCEKFLKAKALFQEMRDDPKSSKTEQAMALIGIARCIDMIKNEKSTKKSQIAYLSKAFKLARGKSVAGTALFLIGRVYATFGGGERYKKSLKYIELYLKRFPEGVYAKEAKFRQMELYLLMGKTAKAKALFKKYDYKRKHPKSGFTLELSRMFKITENKKMKEEK